MYVSPISTFFSRGRSTPAIRAMIYPCRCLCLGLRLQMIRVTPLRFTTRQCSQIGLTLLRTFTGALRRTNDNFGQDPQTNGLSRVLQGMLAAVMRAIRSVARLSRAASTSGSPHRLELHRDRAE